MKFSFVVPVYNCEKTLTRCVESILAQTDTDFEVILVNDGSKDHSLEICHSFQKADARVTVLSQENQGPSAARNFGIAFAKGDYIAFVDSDDYIEKNYILEIQKSIDSSAPDLVFLGFHFEDNESGKILGTASLPTAVYTRQAFPQVLPVLIQADIFGYQWCKVVRRSLLHTHQIQLDPSISLHEDLLFTCDVCRRAERIAVVSKPIYHYIKGIEGLCAKYRSDMPELMDYVNLRLFAFYRDIKIDGLPEMILERAVFTYYLVLKNDRNQSLKSIKARKTQLKSFFNGVTSKAIREHLNIYRKTITGKKKWFYWVLLKTKSIYLYYILARIYRHKG